MKLVETQGHADRILQRAVSRELGLPDWYLRVRESGGQATGKETVESIEANDCATSENALAETLADIALRRGEGDFATHVHIECIAHGAKSPFYTLTMQLRSEHTPIEPTEGAAMAALADMGVRTNRLLYDLCTMFAGELTRSRESEHSARVALAEVDARSEAGDDTARWEAMHGAVVALAPAAQHAAEGFAAQQRAAEVRATRENDAYTPPPPTASDE